MKSFGRTVMPILFALLLAMACSGAVSAMAVEAAPDLHTKPTAMERPLISMDNGMKTQTGNEPSAVTIHRVNLGASNAYLLETDAGLILVDAGVPYSHRMVLRKMKQIGRDDLILIYITHAHIDHYGGADALREKTGAPIAIHSADAESMAKGLTDLGTVRQWERTSDATLPFIEPLLKVTPTEADILVEDGDSLEEFGIDAYVLFTPGHTPGSTTLVVEDRYGFAGDLVASSNGKVHAQRSFAEDWVQVAKSIDRLKSLELELIYPGHGAEPITNSQLKTLRASFVEEEPPAK